MTLARAAAGTGAAVSSAGKKTADAAVAAATKQKESGNGPKNGLVVRVQRADATVTATRRNAAETKAGSPELRTPETTVCAGVQILKSRLSMPCL